MAKRKKDTKKKTDKNVQEVLEADNEILEEKVKQLEELQDKYLRLFAEFDNYKKRMVKERLDLVDRAAEDTLVKLLPVLDDFERAKMSADDEKTDEQFSEGVSLVYNKLHATLKGIGLETMKTNGEDFDAELHEAITKIPAPSDDMKGKVLDTVERGYTLNDKIIRYAKVVVGA